MPIRLLVTWDNPGHALLPDNLAHIEVTADGVALTPITSSNGRREFDIANTAQDVVLTVRFEASLPASGTAPAQQHTVLEADQNYTVANGTQLVPQNMMPRFAQPHPLIDSASATNQSNAMRAHVRTQFVDIQAFWDAYSRSTQNGVYYSDEYAAERNQHCFLRALAYTGGDPLIWFANYTIHAFFLPSNEMPCFVYFRPANDHYTRVNHPHSMFRLNRYLLSPIHGSTNSEKADLFIDPSYVWIRVGMEEALVDSQRPMVLLHPWPSGINFGDATSNQLPNLAYAAVRLLWVLSEVAGDRFDLQLGRLGIGGYSGGAWALWSALRNNRNRIREVYAFDAMGTSVNRTLLRDWFLSNDDNRLRMAGGIVVGQNLAVQQTILQAMPNPGGRLTVWPQSAQEYATPGAIPHWDYVVSAHPNLRNSGGARHQFAMFGSYPGNPAPPNSTFFRQFLEMSGF